MLAKSSTSVTIAKLARSATVSRSGSVVVTDCRFNVSDRMAHSRIFATAFGIHFQGLDDGSLAKLREDTEAVVQMSVNMNRFVPFFLGLFISLCLSRWRFHQLSTIHHP